MGVQLITVERSEAQEERRETQCTQQASRPPYCSLNVLRDIIPDKVYFFLLEHGFFNERMLRNWYIYHRYTQLRAQQLSSGDAIEIIMSELKELSFDTIKKIVYRTGRLARLVLELR